MAYSETLGRKPDYAKLIDVLMTLRCLPDGMDGNQARFQGSCEDPGV